jgi:oligopeptide transport system permease protein
MTLSACVTLGIVLVLTFFLIRFAPGGPFDTDQNWPADIQETLNQKYELDQPLTTQLLHWLNSVAHGDLRESFHYMGRPVTTLIAESLPVSAQLGALSLLFALTVGILLGCLAAMHPRTLFNQCLSGFFATCLSLPSYLVASLLILIFASWLNLLPAALWQGDSSLVLPVLSLGLRPLALIGSLTASSLSDVMKADFIRTALSKGLTPAQVLLRHALKNALLPVITLLGPLSAHLITGSFLIETVFQIPGMGRHLVLSVFNRDYPLVLGVTLTYGIILLGSQLLVDVLLVWMDPRIRMGET